MTNDTYYEKRLEGKATVVVSAPSGEEIAHYEVDTYDTIPNKQQVRFIKEGHPGMKFSYFITKHIDD